MSSIKKCSDCHRVVKDYSKQGGTRYVMKDGKYFCDSLCVDNYISRMPYYGKNTLNLSRIQTKFMHKNLPVCLVVEDSTFRPAYNKKVKKLSTGRA